MVEQELSDDMSGKKPKALDCNIMMRWPVVLSALNVLHHTHISPSLDVDGLGK